MSPAGTTQRISLGSLAILTSTSVITTAILAEKTLPPARLIVPDDAQRIIPDAPMV
jgi:hypothetical protein